MLLAVTLCLGGWPAGTSAQTGTLPAWQIRVLRSLGLSGQAHTATIKNVRMLADGRRALTCSMDGSIGLWDLPQGRLLRRLTDPSFEAIYCLATLHDESQVLAAGIGPGVALWDLDRGEKIRQFDHDATIFCISVFADEKSFVCGDDQGRIVRFPLDGKAPPATCRKSADDITAIAVLPDQSGFVSGNRDGDVHRWKLAAEQPEEEFEGLTTWACCLQFSGDASQLLGTDYAGNVVLWNFGNRQLVWKKESLAGDICWGRFIDDQQLAVVDKDDAFYVIDRASGKTVKRSIVIPEAAGFDLSADRTTLWSGGTRMICGWDLASGQQQFPDPETMTFAKGFRSLAVRDRHVYVATGGLGVVMLEADGPTTGRQIEFRESLAIPWSNLQLVPLDRGLAICSAEGVAVADYDQGQVLFAKKLPNTGCIAAPQPGRVAFADNDNLRIRELDIASGKVRTLLEMPSSQPIGKFCFCDDQHVAVTIDRRPAQLQIRSLDSGNVVLQHTSQRGFLQLAAATGLLVARDQDQRPLVFSAPGREAGPLAPAEIDRLMRNLDSGQYAVRTAAMRRLIGGGPAVLEHLPRPATQSLETRIRLATIRQVMSTATLPDLNRPLSADPRVSAEPEVLGLDPNGRFFLMTVRNAWKSELLVAAPGPGAWKVVARQPLRSRATHIQPIPHRPGTFAIGYGDGAVDLIEILRPAN
jgi:hypothetical protein